MAGDGHFGMKPAWPARFDFTATVKIFLKRLNLAIPRAGCDNAPSSLRHISKGALSPVGCRVSAKLKRTAKAAGIVGVAGIFALIGAKPVVVLVQHAAPSASSPPRVAEDFESEHPVHLEHSEADSEIADRAAQPVEKVLHVESGSTLKDLLLKAGADPNDATEALTALRSVYDPRNLRAGQAVTVTFEQPANAVGPIEFQRISLNASPEKEVSAKRGPNNEFQASETKRQVSKEIAHYSGTIKSSLFESASAAGVPITVITAMIHALSYDVDFQRDLQSGDSFDVMVEGYYDSKGKLLRTGDMLYAAVTLSGRPIAMYRFEDGEGSVEYFNDKGESVKKALLRTPVDGARITSGFGMRFHPILGYTTMHKGVDFGVPTGTPIMAAGDGVVEKAGFNGSYGNYVRLRHANGFGTAYAHMSRIAPGIHPGKHVSQGQVIGFVGATGRATGPHLHFEVLEGNVQVNPMTVKMPTNTKLAGKDLDRFRTAKAQIDALRAAIPPSTARVASDILGKAGPLTD
jgi:murein DD-endopeptidase MepM/ murein hydrolase activator NlpD